MKSWLWLPVGVAVLLALLLLFRQWEQETSPSGMQDSVTERSPDSPVPASSPRATGMSPDARAVAAAAIVSRAPTRLTADQAAIVADRMYIPGNPLIEAGISLVRFEDNTLTPAARDVLYLDDGEVRALQGYFVNVQAQVDAIRRERGSVHRKEDGSIEIDFDDRGWKDFLGRQATVLSTVLDQRSFSALRAVGVQQLLTSPFMVGLAGADPIPDDPGNMTVRVREGGYTFGVKMSRASLDTILRP